ncbi:hypothetical protein [Streptococcus oricebi]|uniref:Bacteriocin immunity protein n=1 Tax=Streptococcus oricebi TaxID=1547447 RepID=A0ABS5B3T0_9STRE|nr:hypothetical protein [Streptococcus oricebi]MBP2623474.1 hypothetical protein [Streptococcus oricebi]
MIKRRWALLVAVICTLYAPYRLYQVLTKAIDDPAHTSGAVIGVLFIPAFFYFLAFYKKKK